MSDITPGRVYRETGKWFVPVLFAGVAVIVLGAILTLVGWQVGWLFTSANATRNAELIQNGYSNQTTLRQQVTSKLADVTQITAEIGATTDDPAEVSALQDQRAAEAGIVCGDAAQITGTPLPAQQASWVAVNCSAGSLSPSSTLYVTGAP